SDDDYFPLYDSFYGISGDVTVSGFGGSDLYILNLYGQGAARFNIYDKTPSGDLGVDRLMIYGTDDADFFLFRPFAISSLEVDESRQPVSGGVVERVNYDTNINGGVEVYGRDGDDTFVFDDTSTVMTIYGDAGDDTFQIGQMFQSPRDASNPANGLAPEDYFPTTQTTQGFLSNGVSFSATMYGGTGQDSFTVYRSLAEIFLYGEEDDDTFRVRAFVKVDPNDPKAPITNVNGGQGADFIEYTVNAPINIDGGDGFDTLTVVGTEFGDDFVVTDKGVYGAGLPVRYGGIEKVSLDGMEGNDTFFIASTDENVQVEIYGGRGSDTFNVSGGTDGPITVVAKDLEGHSGLIQHDVSSSDALFNALYANDLRVIVADNDAAGVAVIDGGAVLKVAETGALAASYALVLTRPPEEDIRITASPSKPKESDQKAGGKGVSLSTDSDPSTGNSDGVTLLFTKENWYQAQTVYVTAGADDLAEGNRFFTIQHNVIQGGMADDGGAYDGLAVASIVAEVIDNNAASVVISETQNETVVSESGDFATEDQYQVVLSKRPTGDVIIDIATDGQVTATSNSDQTYLTFTTDNWDTPQYVKVSAVQDAIDEGVHYSRITHEIRDISIDNFYGVTLDDVVVGIASALNGDVSGGFEAEIIGQEITVARTDGSGFSAKFSGSNAVTGSISGTQAGDVWQNADMTLSTPGTIGEGEVWMIVLNGTAYSYETASGDDLTAVIDGLLSALGKAPFDISRTGDTLSIAPMAEKTFSSAQDNILVNGQPYKGETIRAEEIFAISLKGVNYVYIAGSNNDPLDFNAVGEGLKSSVEQGGIYTCDFNGTTLTVNPAFDAFTAELKGAGTISGTASVTGTNSSSYYSEITLELSGSGSIGADSAWILNLNGVDYNYMVGSNGEKLNIQSVDVKITDDEVPGVLITQTDGDTTTTEPTDDVIMGTGQVTSDGTTAEFEADFGSSVINEAELHDSFYNAQDLDFASWSDNANAEIAQSTILPHLTIKGTGDGQMDYYTFTITPQMLAEAGGDVQAIFDIDHGFEWGDPVLWGAQLMLFGPTAQQTEVTLSGIVESGDTWSINLDGNNYSVSGETTLNDIALALESVIDTAGLFSATVESNKLTITQADGEELEAFTVDLTAPVNGEMSYENLSEFNATGLVYDDGQYWSNPGDGAEGSTSYWDDYLTYSFTRPGDYYIRVDNWLKHLSFWTSGKIESIPTGADYDLNISIEEHDVANFQFSPSPVQEDEGHNNTSDASQSIEDIVNWFTFYDKEIGNEDSGGIISSGTPYAKILGGGDGSWDYYKFYVSQPMLTPTASSLAGTQAAGTYYTEAYINLQGDFGANDLWTLTLNDIAYQYTAGTAVEGFEGDLLTLAGVAAGLGAQLPDNYTVTLDTLDGSILKIQDENGFRIDGLSQLDQAAGTVTRINSAKDLTGGDIAFTSAALLLSGTPAVDEVWTVTLDGTDYDITVLTGNDLDTAGARLVARINELSPGVYAPEYNTTTNVVSIGLDTGASITDFSLEFSVTGQHPDGSAEISGTPVQTALDVINWSHADIDLLDVYVAGETWTVTLDNTNDGDSTNAVNYSYTAGVNITDYVEQNTVNDVAEGLRRAINSGGIYAATRSGHVISITEKTGASFSAQYGIRSTSTGGSSAWSETITMTGTPAENEVWTVTLDGTDYDITVLTGNDLDTVGERLVTRINELSPGVYAPEYDTATDTITLSNAST
ncbi:MAG: hypothetical protein PHH09_09750, partial [Methanoregulaceae archaeon]|nr:hypothetical protein [Methanoregulaceae archaeon]